MKISTVKVEDINIAKPFSNLFPVNEPTLEGIRIDMEYNGYDEAFPVIVWQEKNVVVDGHTRFTAARELNLESVPVIYRNFENEDDAVLYAFHLQRNRRNLADEDILRCLQVLDSITTSKNSQAPEGSPKPSRKETAELRAEELGTSRSKIEKARKVIEHGNDEIKEAVNSGEKSINKAFNEMQEMRRESGELKGPSTNGLACSSRYKKAVGRLLEEIRRIREDNFQQVSLESVLLDIETIRSSAED